MTKKISTRRWEADLEWFFGAYPSLIGIRAQTYDPSGVHESDAHDRLCEERHRQAITRGAAITRAFEALTLADQVTLRVACEPRGGLSYALRVAFARKESNITLAALAPSLPEAAAAFADDHRTRHPNRPPPAPTPSAVLGWLTDAASANQRRTLATTIAAAHVAFNRALEAYAAVTEAARASAA